MNPVLEKAKKVYRNKYAQNINITSSKYTWQQYANELGKYNKCLIMIRPILLGDLEMLVEKLSQEGGYELQWKTVSNQSYDCKYQIRELRVAQKPS